MTFLAPPPGGLIGWIRWSPVGDMLAFDDFDLGVYLVSVAAGEVRQVSLPSEGAAFPAWSADGSQIVYVSSRAGNSDLVLAAVDGGTPVALTTGPPNDRDPDWSPDGVHIAFASDRAGNLDIYRMNVESGDVSALTDDPAHDYLPRWSPTGERLVFVSERDGQADLYTVDSAGGDVMRLTESSGPNSFSSEPLWDATGTRIAFLASHDGDVGVHIVDVETGDVRPITKTMTAPACTEWAPASP